MGEQMSQPHAEKKTEKYNNNTIQNKMMKIMVLQILREIAKNLQDADLFCNGWKSNWSFKCLSAGDLYEMSWRWSCRTWGVYQVKRYVMYQCQIHCYKNRRCFAPHEFEDK